MATFEELQLANRVVAYLANCHRDLRINAQMYKTDLARPLPVEWTTVNGVVSAPAGWYGNANTSRRNQSAGDGERRFDTAQLGAIATADAQNIARLMTLLTNKITGTLQTKLGNGLTVYGMTLNQANTEKNLILNTANTQASADVSTDQAIISAADATLAALPALDFID